MSRFLDGPAAGLTLSHARAPHFLRVVCNGTSWDLLDRLDDEPRPDEVVHVYQQVPGTHTGRTHINGGTPSTSGWYDSATYRHRPDVDGEQVRTTEAWRAWASAQPRLEERV